MTEKTDRAAVTCVQPIAIVDHIARLNEEELKEVLGDEEAGGSRRVERETINCMLQKTGASKFDTTPGGSSANTIRALSGGFPVHCRLLGARGDDSWGNLFEESMVDAGVDVSRLLVQNTPTGRSLILSCGPDRTMRTCLDGCTRLQAADIPAVDLASEFVVLSAYCMYGGQFTAEIVSRASQGGAAVVLDLASFEIVQKFHKELWEIVVSGGVHTLSGNEDEWLALAENMLVAPQAEHGAPEGQPAENSGALIQNTSHSPASEDHTVDQSSNQQAPTDTKQHIRACAGTHKLNGAFTESQVRGSDKNNSEQDNALQTILAMQREVVKHCQLAVTTRSSSGCVAMSCSEQCNEPAVHMSSILDTTGAGDLFGAGFLYGQLCKFDLQGCCRVGCILGAAATQVEGSFLSPEMWSWAHERIQADASIKLPSCGT